MQARFLVILIILLFGFSLWGLIRSFEPSVPTPSSKESAASLPETPAAPQTQPQ